MAEPFDKGLESLESGPERRELRQAVASFIEKQQVLRADEEELR
jgi:hypothetical protein